MSLIMQYVTGIVFVLMVLASILLMKDVRETGDGAPIRNGRDRDCRGRDRACFKVQ